MKRINTLYKVVLKSVIVFLLLLRRFFHNFFNLDDTKSKMCFNIKITKSRYYIKI